MICVSIADIEIDKALEIMSHSEISEIRLDRLRFNDEEIKRIFSSDAVTLATYRPVDNVTDSMRMGALKKAISYGADMVDIEVENSDEFKNELISFAKEHKCRVIISYHNYEIV